MTVSHSRDRRPSAASLRWGRRCPVGHVSLRDSHTTSDYLCEPCGLYYKGEPIDARDVDEWPLPEDDPRRTVTRKVGDNHPEIRKW